MYFLSQNDRDELEAIPDSKQRTDKLHEKVKPLLRPLSLYFVALCYALQDEDHELSATDTFWLGLLDEVIGGPPDLYPFRLIVENTPGPDAVNQEPAPASPSTDI
jgi:hypothetical protein